MRKHNLAFIDIETTGLDVWKHEIIEIGAVITTPDLEVIEEFELKIKPEHIENADPTSMKINHYDPKDWVGARTLKDAMVIFTDKVKDAIMVGQNVAFDSGFLEHAYAKTNISNTMHYHKFDTISIAWAKLHREPDLEHFSLRELCLRFGIENKSPHTGLGDARATYELYKKLMSL
ncbi:MAG TPA: 3'-5' exonuclease [Candidatus Paceibacterota bacterium]|jgi:DNA polymerase-3 subunit epsilon|nr:3'-5' exonuclease [Candidatus Paceibacterota bacterium]